MVKRRIDSDGCALSVAFCTEWKRLHLLAYILTGSAEVAGECVVDAFKDAQSSFLASPVFAYEAAKLATIKTGLRKTADEIRHYAFRDSAKNDLIGSYYSRWQAHDLESAGCEQFLAPILKLNAFHRAVLLLRVYERYRAYAAALLLRIPSRIVECGKVQAIGALMAQIDNQSIHGEDKTTPTESMTLRLPGRSVPHKSHLQLSGGR